ncbi:MAG: radical SAM protein [Deltaproteobacteria bacterium]|nr:radical SAM protein [Deltaproteobacteria bacterium]
MRLSRFVIPYRDVQPGEHVLYDVVSDRYVGVDDAALESLARWRRGGPVLPAEQEAAEALRELGFLVEGEAEDEARLAGARRTAASGRPGSFYVTLMPTLACDLACTYCFQKDHPAQGHMKPEVEAAALEWIERAVARSTAQKLVVAYIGGEPLARKDYVLRSAARLSAAMARMGRAFEWQLVTNGVSLDVDFARSLSALGQGEIKLTLDGDRETHDAGRVYRDGRGTFDRVFAALVAVAHTCPEIRLRVGGNFREGQEASFEALLDRMAAAGLAGRLKSVDFKPVVEGGCATSCGSRASETLVQLRGATSQRGLTRQAPRGVDQLAPCELHWDDAWTIDPSGRLYKCLAVAGRPELALGDVRSEALRPDPLLAGEPWKACAPDCPFVPVCLGGCLGGKVATGGRLGETACDRPLLEDQFRREIRRRYLEEFHRDEAVNAAAA